MFKNIALIIIVILSASCSSENLNGHFHLEFENSKNFQVWNIKNNRMLMNRPLSEIRDNSFSSQISFRGNKMRVRPWYVINYVGDYSIDENGVVTMDDGKSVMRLVPHSNCIKTQEYFSEKTKNYTNSFQLPDEIMKGEVALPTEKENELIVIRKGSEQSQLLFNGKEIQNVEEIPTTQNESIWLHIDKRMEVGDVVLILKHLNQNGYKYYFSALLENPEQIRLLERNIESINSTEEGFEIDVCEFCDKHPVSQIDSVLKVEILGLDEWLIQGNKVNTQIVGSTISGYLRANRETSNIQIEVIIPETTTFESYLQFMTRTNFSKSDKIPTYIEPNNKALELMKRELRKTKEFPIRIKELIKKKI